MGSLGILVAVGWLVALVSCQVSAEEAPAPASPVAAAPATSGPPVGALVPAPGPEALTEDERNTVAIYEAAAASTVFVTQTQLRRSWADPRPTEVPAGSGTGFVWDQQGHIVTNYHVVDGGRSFKVTLHNQKVYDAVFVGGEPRRDIAVLRIEAPPAELSPIYLPPEDHRLRVGQKTVAIGNPFGLDHTLTTGVISALGREVQGYGGVTIPDMIQTDASINPGNSGGPLLDSQGRLVGMNTMIFSQSGSSAGIGFAVPVSFVRRLVPQILTHGRVVQAGIGVSLVDDTVARRIGVRGVIIGKVSETGPAAAAGVQGLGTGSRGEPVLGDVIVAIDGQAVDDYDDLYNALDRRKPGDKVQIQLMRGGRTRAVEVQLVALE